MASRLSLDLRRTHRSKGLANAPGEEIEELLASRFSGIE